MAEQNLGATASQSLSLEQLPAHLRELPIPLAWWEYAESLFRQLAEAERIADSAFGKAEQYLQLAKLEQRENAELRAALSERGTAIGSPRDGVGAPPLSESALPQDAAQAAATKQGLLEAVADDSGERDD